MVFVIGLLTFVMVLDCLILILLVLIQLPKKEAGAGVAFGGAATDALFGAGSGNVLTKTTKYAAVAFFVLAIVLSLLQSHQFHRRSSEFRQILQQQQNPQVPQLPPAASTQPTTPGAGTPPAQAAPPTGTNLLLSLPPIAEPPATTTNPASAPGK